MGFQVFIKQKKQSQVDQNTDSKRTKLKFIIYPLKELKLSNSVLYIEM